MTRATLPRVNAEIRRRGINAGLVKGKGYLYFVGPAVELAIETSIYVPHVGDLSVETWMQELDALVQESGNRRAEANAHHAKLRGRGIKAAGG